MEITQEQFEQVPEFLKSQYEKQESGAYVSVEGLKVASLKSSLDGLDGKLKTRDTEFNQLNERLTTFEQTKADEIKAATEKALAEAETKGDVDAIKSHYEQQMADLEKRVAERTRGEVENEFTAKQVADKAANLRKLIAKDLAKDADAEASIEFMLGSLLKPNESNEISLYDMTGSATSVKGDDLEAVKAELKKIGQFKHLIDGSSLLPTKNNGIANGGSKDIGDNQVNAKAEEAKKNRDGIGHLNAHFKEAFK